MMHAFVPLAAFAILAGDPTAPDIVNVRPTYGYLGAACPKGAGLLPGDVAHVSFEIKNLKRDGSGRYAYSIAIVITDDKGHVIFEQKPYNSVAQTYFGGTTLPAAVRIEVPQDTKPGAVHWKCTVIDRTTNKSKEITGTGKILPADFGLVQVGTFADAESRFPVAAVGVVGGQIHVGFGVTGFGRGGKEKQPNIKVSLSIRDSKGQLTTAKPLTGEVNKDIDPEVRVIPLHFGLTLDQAGQFTLELTAQDQTSGKTSTVQIPVRILGIE